MTAAYTSIGAQGVVEQDFRSLQDFGSLAAAYHEQPTNHMPG